MCNDCTKAHNNFWKNYIVEKKQKVEIKQTGDYLIIQLLRMDFNEDTYEPEKLKNKINFEENFKVETNKGVKKEENFKLVGIICHEGEPGGGHYFSYNKIGNKWYLFNDRSVSEVSGNNILNVDDIQSNNYILFYKKQ